MCQISSVMAAAEGLVAEFSSFANLEEKKRKSNLLMSFPKTGNQMGSFGQIRKNSFFRFCRPILDIFGLTLLSVFENQVSSLILRKWLYPKRVTFCSISGQSEQTYDHFKSKLFTFPM